MSSIMGMSLSTPQSVVKLRTRLQKFTTPANEGPAIKKICHNKPNALPLAENIHRAIVTMGNNILRS